MAGRLRLGGDLRAVLARPATRRPRRRVRGDPSGDRVVSRCLSSPRSRPTPSGSTPAFAGAALERFIAARLHGAEDRRAARPTPPTASQLVFVGRRGKHLLLDFGRRHLRRPPHAGRAAEARREAVGQAPQRPGPLALRRRPGAAAHRGRARERKAGVWVVDGRPRGAGAAARASAPTPTPSTRPRCRRCSKAHADAAPRVPARPAPARRARAAARQRDLPPGAALAVRQHRQARPRRRRAAARGDRRVHRRGPRRSSGASTR